MITPLYVATVGGRLLRFFRSPLEDGRPDLVWHCVDDLHRCLGLNREARRFFLRKLQDKRDEVRTVATTDGAVSIAPHFVAQGTIDAMIEEEQAPASVRTEYDDASAAAMEKFPIPYAFGTDKWPGWMKAAMNRWEESR